MKSKLGRIVQLIVVQKTLHALTDRGSVYAYREGALEDDDGEPVDGWEALSDLTPGNLVPGEEPEDEEEDEPDEG